MTMSDSDKPCAPTLQVRGLRTEFGIEGAPPFCAINDVSFSVDAGEILGIVGESGSGKSVTGQSIMGLISPPGRVTSGSVKLGDREISNCTERERRKICGSEIAMVFQDPMTSLHPLLRIGDQMVDAIHAHRKVKRKDALFEAEQGLGKVGIPSPKERLSAFPHQLSGGMRQRVAIAIAMLNQPKFIIADEPTTALDVTTQAQILAEVRQICKSSGTGLIWISHDLAVVGELADKIAVMYAGSIVEIGSTDQVLDRPMHPYTAGLLASVPSRNRGSKRLSQIRGTVASASEAEGCKFAPRCDRASPQCRDMPRLDIGPEGHGVRCFHALSSQISEGEH